MSAFQIALIALSFAAALAGVSLWRTAALRFDIVSVQNNRTLHRGAIPVGGGIVVSVVWLTFLAVAYAAGSVSLADFVCLFVGGAFLSALGLADDIADLPALPRFLAQVLTVSFGIAWLGGLPAVPLFDFLVHFGWIGYPVGILFGLWMINLFNFMDGVDAMLASGTVFICTAMGSFLLLDGDASLSGLLYFLAAAAGGFLWFNWPPAKLFMGDAGSIFLGFVVAMLMVITVWDHPDLFWVWLIVLGYFLTDTTTTILLRIIYVRDFYKTHRHHAYQSLARRTKNHLLVTRMVLLIKVLWLLPIAALAYVYGDLGPVFFLIAVLPITVFCAKHGVLHELR